MTVIKRDIRIWKKVLLIIWHEYFSRLCFLFFFLVWLQSSKFEKVSRYLILLLLLSRFSRVWLCATPWTAAYQASPSLGFSRQEHWSGSPFPPPMRESEVAQSCLTLRDPVDCSPPGSSIHGIFNSRFVWTELNSPDDNSVCFNLCIFFLEEPLNCYLRNSLLLKKLHLY